MFSVQNKNVWERKKGLICKRFESMLSVQRGNLSKLNVDVMLTRVDVYRIFQNLPDVDT